MHKARSFGGVALFLTIVALALPARTTSAWGDTRADIFSVSVPVDATAASAQAAREAARADGERKAYVALIDRLTLARDRGKVPPANDTILNQVIQGFEVANERRSTVRYLATYTFRFRPNAVEQLLRAHGVPFAETVSKPVVVLPVLKNPNGRAMLWDDPNPWRDAWAKAPPPPGLVPMTVPLGAVEDVSAIDAETADAGDDAHLQAISANYDHDDVLVTRATIKGEGGPKTVDVSTTRFVPGSPGGEQSWVATYTANPGQSDADLLASAVAGTVAQVEEAWKQANILDYSQSATLVVSVPTDDLNSWVAVRQHLATTAAVQSTDLISLDRHGARVALHYVGSADQLRIALAQNDLTLSGSDPNWVLLPAGAAPPPAMPAAAPTPGSAPPMSAPPMPTQPPIPAQSP
ncbi:MAG TPA: DUF2066 domain-containing protein, partial [Stellaceae bacterium]|nr:DUF2066 domain-containing protein [Stellaceae bacterium]